MKTPKKIIIATAIVGSFGFGGLAPNVYAAQPESSILVAQDRDRDSEAKEDEKEQQEEAQLQSLAKITAQQAIQAAETAKGGKASSVELENENGNLVYEVTIGQTEVYVDAGNGTVLYTEDKNQENEQSEASRPKSSIQVPDNDGEANDDGTKR
jgi:hypothetical protein